jgi:hypothetical protein
MGIMQTCNMSNVCLHDLGFKTPRLPCPGVGGIHIPSTGGAVAAAYADGVVFGVGIGSERERRGNLDGLHWISGGVWGSKGGL